MFNLKTRKSKLILVASIASVAIVATAIAVPVALLTNKPEAKTVITPTQQSELNKFMAAYPGVIDQTGGKITVKAEAFKDNNTLPADFALPAVVTDIGADAFNGANLSLGFTIPANAKNIDPSAFEQAVISDDLVWEPNTYEAGSKLSPLVDNQEYKDFMTAYPGKLNKKTIVESAFVNCRLAGDFAIPSFVTRIDAWAFSNAVPNEGFTLPKRLVSIGGHAFDSFTAPRTFVLPRSLKSLGIGPLNVDAQENSLANIVLYEGFTIPDTLEKIWSTAFDRADFPKGFHIPATSKIYQASDGGPGLVTDPDITLKDNVPVAGCMWDDPRGGVAGATVVEKTTTDPNRLAINR